MELAGFAEALEGLSAGAAGGPPKKSRPSNESPGFVCAFCGADALRAGARVPGVSVVLGRAGGDIDSPNISMIGAGFVKGAAGWLEAEEARREEDRSN